MATDLIFVSAIVVMVVVFVADVVAFGHLMDKAREHGGMDEWLASRERRIARRAGGALYLVIRNALTPA